MPQQRTSKSIAERIDIDYYLRPHPLRRLKTRLAWFAIFATVVPLLIAGVLGKDRIYQAAPVSHAHAFIADDCERCHASRWSGVAELLATDRQYLSTPDGACRKCHDVRDHVSKRADGEQPACASCHREHRPEKQLARVADAHCVRCHRTLKELAPETTLADVSSIFREHPEFAIHREPIASDSTNLLFNHSVHANPKGIAGPTQSIEVLTCASCHQPDEGRRHFLPVTYERHCSRCHSKALVFDAAEFPDEPAPHGSMDSVVAAIQRRYLELLITRPGANVVTERDYVRLNPADPRPTELMLEPSTEWLRDQVATAETRLADGAGGCRLCHRVERNEAGRSVPNATPPSHWLAKSEFRHASHRFLGCIECHPKARSSAATDDVMIPAIDNCKQCHATSPARSHLAGDDCVQCHSYHDHPNDRDFDGKLRIDLTEFLSRPENP